MARELIIISRARGGGLFGHGVSPAHSRSYFDGLSTSGPIQPLDACLRRNDGEEFTLTLLGESSTLALSRLRRTCGPLRERGRTPPFTPLSRLPPEAGGGGEDLGAVCGYQDVVLVAGYADARLRQECLDAEGHVLAERSRRSPGRSSVRDAPRTGRCRDRRAGNISASWFSSVPAFCIRVDAQS